MKIAKVESVIVWNGFRNFLFVVVHTDTGLTGVGESGLSGREYSVEATIKHFEPLLIGQDPMRTEHLNQVMSRGAFFPATHIQASAISAIDVALWDIKGKALNVPVYQLLGGCCRDKVLAYCHLRDWETLPVMIDSAKKQIDAGWKALRFGLPIDGLVVEPRKSVRKAIEWFGELRKAVGEDIELIIDVHTRLNLPEAIRLGRELEAFDPLFFEDPLRSEKYDLYRALRPHIHVPIGAGEQCGTKYEMQSLIEEHLIDYCRVDPCLVGGLTEAKKVAGWCEVHHIQLAVHNPLGPVSTAACVHFNLSVPNFGIMEQPKLPGVFPDIFPVQSEWVDGYMTVPTAPGLGIEFNMEAARKRPGRDWEPPQTRRVDGSVTNW